MKATLEFNLNDEEDMRSHIRCVMSLELASCLYQLNNYLRNQLKYNEEEMSQDAYESVEKVRDRFYQIMNDEGIYLDRIL